MTDLFDPDEEYDAIAARQVITDMTEGDRESLRAFLRSGDLSLDGG